MLVSLILKLTTSRQLKGFLVVDLLEYKK